MCIYNKKPNKAGNKIHSINTPSPCMVGYVKSMGIKDNINNKEKYHNTLSFLKIE
jgi:hypothetical protein